MTPWTVACQAPLSMGILQAKNTGVGCHALLQGIFPTQGLNPGLPHCRRILYHLSHQENPRILEWVAYIPSPVDLPDPGIKPGSPALQADSLTIELSEKTNRNKVHNKCNLLKSFQRIPQTLVHGNFVFDETGNFVFKETGS